MISREIFVGTLQKLCVILFICISLWACQDSETTGTQQEKLNNNSSGMDQDHTAAPPDTLAIPDTNNSDTTGL